MNAHQSARRQGVMDASEAERRASRTDCVERLFRARPREWITASELALVGGFCAWRTRVADARRRFVNAGEGSIEWNGAVRSSAYRFVPCASRLETSSSAGPVQEGLF